LGRVGAYVLRHLHNLAFTSLFTAAPNIWLYPYFHNCLKLKYFFCISLVVLVGVGHHAG